jgi:hypothetical protein
MGSKQGRAKLPKKILIGPLTWKIDSSLSNFNSVQVTIEPCLGATQLESLTITLKPDMPRELERETLLHEILHACYATAGLPLDHAKPDDIEEVSVTALSPWLLVILRANPDLVAYLTDV